jgi:hypothetical protein
MYVHNVCFRKFTSTIEIKEEQGVSLKKILGRGKSVFTWIGYIGISYVYFKKCKISSCLPMTRITCNFGMVRTILYILF